MSSNGEGIRSCAETNTKYLAQGIKRSDVYRELGEVARSDTETNSKGTFAIRQNASEGRTLLITKQKTVFGILSTKMPRSAKRFAAFCLTFRYMGSFGNLL